MPLTRNKWPRLSCILGHWPFPVLFCLMPESELLKYWISKFSSRIVLAISFPLTSKPFTIMHKSSIMDFKKCFKEKEIMVYFRKRIRLKHARWDKYQERWKCEQNIQTNEHMDSFIKLISRWFSQWVTSLDSPKYPLDRSFAPVEIAILLRKPFIDLSLHEPPFRVFSSCFSFLGMPFFILLSFFFIVSLCV